MKVLIACEFSGRVREAFRALGHNAWSCDILPAEDGSPFHFQEDVIPHLRWGWDLMIAHPPCQYLAVSGLHWNTRQPERRLKTAGAIAFVRQLMEAPIPLICVENPVSCISTHIRRPDQIIQPYQFGHPESKKTCLWLKGLQKLVPTNILNKPECGYWDNQTPSGQNKLGPSPTRSADRSRTYQGIADAMAHQWGGK